MSTEPRDLPSSAPPTRRAGARRAALTALAALGALASLASLVLLASTAQDAHLFNELQPWLLLINVSGVFVLLALIGRKLYELGRDWRAQVPGSRMKARAVLMSSALALAPILVVYFFSVNAQFAGIMFAMMCLQNIASLQQPNRSSW